MDPVINQQLNGVNVDIEKLISTYGPKGQIQASKHLHKLTGASLKECVKFASDVYKNKDLAQQIVEKANAKEAQLQDEKVLYCPKCLSTSVNVNKKGLRLG